MEITIHKSEGMSGAQEELGPIDSGELPPELQGEIEEEIRKVDFFDLPTEPEGDPAFDADAYRISIVDGDRAHAVAFNIADERGLGRLRSLIEKSGAGYHSVPLAGS
jgi:hypothetical protein